MAVHARRRNLAVAARFIACGGVLWRESMQGVEICVVRAPDRWVLPRGRVHEDERLGDAAVRQVFEKTGFMGCAQNRFEPVSLGTGELGYFFLLRAARRRDGSEVARADLRWVPFSEGYHLVGSAGERAILLQAAGVIGTLHPVV